MVNVDDLNKIIDSLKADAGQIHEISQLCGKIAEVANEVENQQASAVANSDKLSAIAETMSSMQKQYNNALNKLSTATDVLETSATELKTEMKRFENDNNDRLEDFRAKTAAQLSANESAIEKELDHIQKTEREALNDMSIKLQSSIYELVSGLKTVRIISIIGALCALAAVLVSFLH
jgi:septal ring factor EnvC (AmiA/AmiB activator)